MNKILLWAGLITGFCVVSCNSEVILETTAFHNKDYPLRVGNWWQYQVVHFAVTTDTILLIIVDQSQTTDATIYNCHLKQFGSIVDSGQFILSKTDLIYKGMNPQHSRFGGFRLQLPFYQGDVWKGAALNDSTEVISFSNNNEVLGKKYATYYLKRVFFSPANRIVNALQVSKGIGLVGQDISTSFNGFSNNYSFELIDYYLAK